MAEALAAHLAALPAPQLKRIALRVLGTADDGDRALLEQRLHSRLCDPQWLADTISRLSDPALASLEALGSAGVPVVRADAAALFDRSGGDPFEELEEHGLVTPVRTGRGMPTHVALTPGMDEMLRARVTAISRFEPGRGVSFAGAQRRFELALLVAIVGQHPPRMTKQGRLHAGDLNALAEHVEPLGLRPSTLERRLSRWQELGVVAPNEGRLQVLPSRAADIEGLYLRLALQELAAPATPDGTLVVVSRLLEKNEPAELRPMLEVAQSSLLRERAGDEQTAQRSVRREFMEAMTTLLGLDALLIMDAKGHPLPASSEATLQATLSGEKLTVALDESVAATLTGTEPPPKTFSRGHVQSSFEVVADPSCDPALVARVGLCARLVRADRAAVLQLDQKAVARGRALGIALESLLSDLAALSGKPVPPNVATILADWFRQAPAAQDSAEGMFPVPPLDGLRNQALTALEASRSGVLDLPAGAPDDRDATSERE